MNDIRGKIMLVGIGPGSTEHMTARARAAIAAQASGFARAQSSRAAKSEQS